MTSARDRLPSQAELHDLFTLDAERGLLFWRERPRDMFPSDWSWKVWNKRFAGEPALRCWLDDYWKGRLFGKPVRACRVIWKMVHGTEPPTVDHENGDTSFDGIGNLRAATHAENMQNTKLRRDSSSGVTGVARSGGGWRAYIGSRHIGCFPTIEEAARARQVAEVAEGYHPNHGRVVEVRSRVEGRR